MLYYLIIIPDPQGPNHQSIQPEIIEEASPFSPAHLAPFPQSGPMAPGKRHFFETANV